MGAATSNRKPVKIVCPSEAPIDVELHVSHETTLELCNVRWLVKKQRLSEPLLGRLLIEVLGLNTPEMLTTAADRFAGAVDAEHLVESVVN